jgi:hypothetical protein
MIFNVYYTKSRQIQQIKSLRLQQKIMNQLNNLNKKIILYDTRWKKNNRRYCFYTNNSIQRKISIPYNYFILIP